MHIPAGLCRRGERILYEIVWTDMRILSQSCGKSWELVVLKEVCELACHFDFCGAAADDYYV